MIDRLSSGLLKLIFGLYRNLLSPMLLSFGVSRCIYLPTCSEYAYIAIDRFGWIKGTRLALTRLARCNPLSTGGLDPVPDPVSKH